MAKKKTKKTDTTKRTKKTDSPKTRKTRKPKSVVTTEPAINTVLGEANEKNMKSDFISEINPMVVSWTPPAPKLYAHSQAEKELLESGWKHDLTTDDFVFHTDTQNTCCGGCNPNAPWWRKADEKMNQFKNWFGNKVERAMHWAFDHPLAFTISLLSFFLGVSILVLLSTRK